MKNKFLAIIPARGGSKGVPRKNLLKLGEKTLLALAIAGAKSSNYITRVICSTDDEEMMEEAKRSGAEVLFKRPAELATDTASSWSVVQHAIKWLEENEDWSPEYIVLLQPTTPFRKGDHIDEAITQMFFENKKSCLSVREVDYPPHWMFFINDNGQGKRLFSEGVNITRRQDAPVAWQPNGLMYVINRQELFSNPTLPKSDTCFYKMSWDVSINIDCEWQYELAKVMWSKCVTNKLQRDINETIS